MEIYIRYLEETDASQLLQIRTQNRDFFQKFEPVRPESHFTYEEQLNEIKRAKLDAEKDTTHTMGIFLKNSETLIGRISLSGIVRGPFQNANLGYYLAQEHNGNGYVTEAVRITLHHAFRNLNLHRIQAAVMPTNIPSKRILEKTGFLKEGFAVRYLKINGVWEDHEIYALTKEDYDEFKRKNKSPSF